ncbi:MAG: hypothetical protein QOJ19_1562 [Acidimicrobiia bacterium]|nr:hypothetical protein [Acidimicrobiia bacterium]
MDVAARVVTEQVVVGEVRVVDVSGIDVMLGGPVVVFQRILRGVDMGEIAVGQIHMRQVVVPQPAQCELGVRQPQVRGIVAGVVKRVMSRVQIVPLGQIVAEASVVAEVRIVPERCIVPERRIVAELMRGLNPARVETVTEVLMPRIGNRVLEVLQMLHGVVAVEIDIVAEIRLVRTEMAAVAHIPVHIGGVRKLCARCMRLVDMVSEHRVMQIRHIVMQHTVVVQARLMLQVVPVLPGHVVVVEALQPHVMQVQVHEVIEPVERVHVCSQTRREGISRVAQGFHHVARIEPGEAVRAQVPVRVREVGALGERLLDQMFDQLQERGHGALPSR